MTFFTRATKSNANSDEETCIDEQAPLRVLIYQFFPGGGIGRYTHELATALSQHAGLKLTVVCSSNNEWLNHANYDVRTLLPTLSHRIPVIRRAKFLSAQLNSPRKLWTFACEESADVVHLSNINHISFPIWRRWIPGGCSLSATVHDVKRAKSLLNRNWEDSCLKSFYNCADSLFVHSQSQLDELVEWSYCDRRKIEIVPHGVYSYPNPIHASAMACRRELGLPEDALIGLFFGQIRDNKNLEGAIRALKNSHVRSHLVVAGSGNLKGNKPIEFYRRLVDSLGLTDRVHFSIGYVSEKNVGSLFMASDWVSLTYDRSFTSQSGVLNVAMYYRRPVLVTPTPTIRQTMDSFNVGVSADTYSPFHISLALSQLEAAIRDNHVFEFEKYVAAHSWQANALATLASWTRVRQERMHTVNTAII